MDWCVRGSFVALITPFDEKGKIDWRTFEKLVMWHLSQGTEGLICGGSTGEGTSLSDFEKKKLASLCLEVVDGKIPVIMNSGSSDTRHAVRLTEQMLHLGVDGCLVAAPAYSRPTQRGCVLHFTEIAKVGLPLILYNNPKRSGISMDLSTIAELAKLSKVIGYKDSTGDIDFIRKVHQMCSIPILSGNDDLTYETLLAGGVGAISVIGNIFPKLWKKMIDLSLDGNLISAKKIVERLYPLCKAINLEVNPQCIKFIMSWFGQCLNHLRLPLISSTEEVENKIKQAYFELSLPMFRSQLKVN